MNNKNTMCVAFMVILTVLCFWSGVMMFYEPGKDSFTDIDMMAVASSGIGEWSRIVIGWLCGEDNNVL